MITGAVMVIGGLIGGLYGATHFNVGQMVAGWVIAGAGAVILFISLVPLP